jgi:hypothetical protein
MMEIIEGNFSKETDPRATVESGLKRVLENVDLSLFDEMVLVMNSTKGEGTTISTNCNTEVTYFLLHYAAQSILNGEMNA